MELIAASAFLVAIIGGLIGRRLFVNAREAEMDREAEWRAATCEICHGTAVYLCPTCRVPIANHTHENDYICDTHGFVHPIRERDGARINGDGIPGSLSILGYEQEPPEAV
jgi:hypothetical protein